MYLFSVTAFANDYSDQQLRFNRLEDQLNSLKNTMNVLQKQFYNTNSDDVPSEPLSELTPKQDVKIEALNEQVRVLNGRIDAVQYDIVTLSEKLDAFFDTVDSRLFKIESNEVKPFFTNDALGGAESNTLVSASDKSQKPASEEEQYDQSFSYLTQGLYKDAIKGFQNLITYYPKGKNLHKSHYWLGESFFVSNQYENAAIQFLKSYQVDSTGEKAAESLLRMGQSLAKTEKIQEACATWSKLENEFDSLKTSVKQDLKIQLDTYRCAS